MWLGQAAGSTMAGQRAQRVRLTAEALVVARVRGVTAHGAECEHGRDDGAEVEMRAHIAGEGAHLPWMGKQA